MVYAVVRVRGTVNVNPDIKKTLQLLKLTRANHCVLVDESKVFALAGGHGFDYGNLVFFLGDFFQCIDVKGFADTVSRTYIDAQFVFLLFHSPYLLTI